MTNKTLLEVKEVAHRLAVPGEDGLFVVQFRENSALQAGENICASRNPISKHGLRK